MLSVLPLLLSAPAIAFVFQGAGHTSFLAHQLPVQRVVRGGVSSMTAQRRFEVCQGKHCRKRGSKNTLALFEELAADSPGIIVQAADMSHTEHGCFDECTMGPNVRVDGDGPGTDGGRIINGVKTKEDCEQLLK
uniref:Uncharacterized protein n=1 Tax=Chrysotila carterae TaxID=13221 RepID=A0A6S9TBU6_CHRCT|mmetsp:Transcript_37286/g.78520  ORF Transcript_37286/g.78520 Transcript_37286/m.78520 type:complete len:134 (-) Transcript_37286:424-825(-)